MRTIIFDLDGTLLRQVSFYPQTQALYFGAAHAHWLDHDAFSQVAVERYGKTDMQVARDLVKEYGKLYGGTIQFDRLGTEFLYVGEFLKLCPSSLVDQVRAGTVRTLGALRQSGYDLRLATGNCWSVAMLKMQRSEMAHLFNIEWGGYGVHEKRADVLRMAMRGAQDPVYVCDTARDVEEGQALGLSCIAIVTDEQSEVDLREADGMIYDLPSLPDLLKEVGGYAFPRC